MIRFSVFFVFLVFFVGFFSVSAQQLKFEHYNDEDGLSHNSVRHIVQDNQGFLWLGTFSGLNRFDGYQFKSYLSSSFEEQTIHNDDITGLEFDETTNSLWIGTRKGLTLFKTDTRKFKTYLTEKNNPNSLPDEEIRSVYVDKFKRVWVGTRTSGVYLFYPDTEIFEKIDLPNFEYVKEIFEDKKGNIWIGSFGTASVAKISLNKKGEFSEIKEYTLSVPNSNKKNPYLNFIFEDFKSDIFIGTREGLYKLDKSTNTFKNLYVEDKTIREKLGPYFLSIALAPNGKYWVGTLGGLLVCDQLEDIPLGNYEWYYSVLSDDTSLVDNLISSLYFDPSGVLWIGTEDGLDKYDPYENQFYLNKDISLYIDNQAPRIRGFAKTYDGHTIVATWHNGLFINKDEEITPLYDNKTNIASIYATDGKTFYCGLWDGRVLIYDYLKNKSKIIDVGFVNVPVFSFLKYDKNTLFISSFGQGTVVLDLKTLKLNANYGKILPGFEVNKIRKNENDLWFATETGLVKYNPLQKTTKHYEYDSNNKYGLPHDNVSDVLIDQNKNIWAATRKALSVYNYEKDNFELVLEPKSLKGKWITDLTTDSYGRIWLNMNNNTIAQYEPNTKKAKIYNIMSGNRLDVFSSSGFYNFNNSKIYIAGKEGVLYFSLQNIKENKYSPSPVITEFKVENKEIFPGTTINGQVLFEKDLNYSKSVVLDYNNRNFSIQFSSPSFTNERQNKYQYKLEGFDKDWIETTSDSRTVQYTNLFSKDYVFKIRASNSDGIWSETSTYNIKVLPTFWLTYKGISLIVFVLGLLIYFSRKQIKLRLELKQELLLEKVKRERDEKLNNEKLRFFTNISHELRTPLTLILGPVKQLLQQENASSYERSRVDLIYQNANRLLRLVNQILDFRRAETGALKLKVYKVDIVINTKNIFTSFIELSHTKNINFNLNIETDSLFCWIDMDKYNKILYNLLSNAMKFTDHYGNVDLFIGLKEGHEKILKIEVSDDGIGIPLESQEKIFSRFYQAQNSKSSTTGTGIGLSLVKALVEIHKGEIKVESTPGVGSIFTVELPVGKEAYSEDERFDISPTDEVETLIPIKQIEASFENINTKKAKTNTDVKHKILVIDDNTELRKYVVEYLSAYFKVYEAENGKEGLEVCKKIKPVLCVVDVMMPVMDGFDFVEALKADENLSHTAVVLLTALAENENRIKGYKIGVDGYLVKPFDPSLLKTRIDNIIKIHFDLKQKFSGEAESDVISLAHSQIDIELISNIKSIIEDNISNPELTSGFLCEQLAMSSSKLYRKITQLTDLSPNEFIRTIRLKKSAQLLKTKNYNVSEVADMVGFNDPLYFSRCFKKQFGHSPSTLLK
ncbi:two-component regulator propeller domain-containing protein [Wenyingzhuangia sp. chi5]|uniref:histidine kinase n=1 Tax=Wenyingzhuangia gilva TaxID=3057677 RepID=A0ABT8VRK9_9FLAO|nr:hybrid sensor histidine kinase/response regulator transcription factor [Wenyingzhuangia sp. chi5]MDO3694606.1 two-component regulator propeller domain-containing protein [Wenyingzhuangia sp. chi5]